MGTIFLKFHDLTIFPIFVVPELTFFFHGISNLFPVL